MKPLLRSACALVLLASALVASAQDALVANGSFETGDLSGWTVSRAASGSDLSVGFGGHAGHYAAAFGATDGLPDAISQTIATVPGRAYRVSYWLLNGAGDLPAPESFVATFGGASQSVGTVSPNYALLGFTAVATSTSTILSLAGYHGLNDFLLDDVSVVAVQPAPEPSALAALGLGTVSLARRRRKA